MNHLAKILNGWVITKHRAVINELRGIGWSLAECYRFIENNAWNHICGIQQQDAVNYIEMFIATEPQT